MSIDISSLEKKEIWSESYGIELRLIITTGVLNLSFVLDNNNIHIAIEKAIIENADGTKVYEINLEEKLDIDLVADSNNPYILLDSNEIKLANSLNNLTRDTLVLGVCEFIGSNLNKINNSLTRYVNKPNFNYNRNLSFTPTITGQNFDINLGYALVNSKQNIICNNFIDNSSMLNMNEVNLDVPFHVSFHNTLIDLTDLEVNYYTFNNDTTNFISASFACTNFACVSSVVLDPSKEYNYDLSHSVNTYNPLEVKSIEESKIPLDNFCVLDISSTEITLNTIRFDIPFADDFFDISLACIAIGQCYNVCYEDDAGTTEKFGLVVDTNYITNTRLEVCIDMQQTINNFVSACTNFNRKFLTGDLDLTDTFHFEEDIVSDIILTDGTYEEEAIIYSGTTSPFISINDNLFQNYDENNLKIDTKIRYTKLAFCNDGSSNPTRYHSTYYQNNINNLYYDDKQICLSIGGTYTQGYETSCVLGNPDQFLVCTRTDLRECSDLPELSDTVFHPITSFNQCETDKRIYIPVENTNEFYYKCTKLKTNFTVGEETICCSGSLELNGTNYSYIESSSSFLNEYPIPLGKNASVISNRIDRIVLDDNGFIKLRGQDINYVEIETGYINKYDILSLTDSEIYDIYYTESSPNQADNLIAIKNNINNQFDSCSICQNYFNLTYREDESFEYEQLFDNNSLLHVNNPNIPEIIDLTFDTGSNYNSGQTYEKGCVFVFKSDQYASFPTIDNKSVIGTDAFNQDQYYMVVYWNDEWNIVEHNNSTTSFFTDEDTFRKIELNNLGKVKSAEVDKKVRLNLGG
jgi:hypothetical protein